MQPLHIGWKIWCRGGTARAAMAATVRSLKDNKLCNVGKGVIVIDKDGTVALQRNLNLMRRAHRVGGQASCMALWPDEQPPARANPRAILAVLILMARTIIVSNRLPTKVHRTAHGLDFQPSEGGLATGLGSIYRADGNVWVGWPGLFVDDAAEQATVTERLRADSMAPVFLTEAEIRDYYEGFSNSTLWPTFHYFTQFATYDDKHWQAYVAANEKFCEAVLALAGGRAHAVFSALARVEQAAKHKAAVEARPAQPGHGRVFANEAQEGAIAYQTHVVGVLGGGKGSRSHGKGTGAAGAGHEKARQSPAGLLKSTRERGGGCHRPQVAAGAWPEKTCYLLHV